jgi:hypothetical protein
MLGGGHAQPLPPGADLDPVDPAAPAVVLVQHRPVGLGVGVGGPQRTHDLGRERLERTLGRGEAVVTEQTAQPRAEHRVLGEHVGQGGMVCT